MVVKLDILHGITLIVLVIVFLPSGHDCLECHVCDNCGEDTASGTVEVCNSGHHHGELSVFETMKHQLAMCTTRTIMRGDRSVISVTKFCNENRNNAASYGCTVRPGENGTFIQACHCSLDKCNGKSPVDMTSIGYFLIFLFFFIIWGVEMLSSM